MKGITRYQLEILTQLSRVEKETGKLADFDQLLSSLSWTPTKESAQFTIRAVIGKGFIEKTALESRRGRNRVCYRITSSGKEVLDPRELAPVKSDKEAESFMPELSEFDGTVPELLED